VVKLSLVRSNKVARLDRPALRGWLLVRTLVNLILADAIVWFVIAQGSGHLVQ
jgi:hypothetical protein